LGKHTIIIHHQLYHELNFGVERADRHDNEMSFGF